MFSGCFPGISVCGNVCVSGSICASGALFLGSFLLPVWSLHPVLCGFVLFYLIDVCLHTNERDKKESMDLGGWVFEKELRAGGNNNQSMLYEKNRFSIKK